MNAMASWITIVSHVCSGADQRIHQSITSLAFVRWIYRSTVDSPNKVPVKWKMFPFDDVIIVLTHPTYIIGTLLYLQHSFYLTHYNCEHFIYRIYYTIVIISIAIKWIFINGKLSSGLLRRQFHHRRRQRRLSSVQPPGVGVTKAPFVNFSLSKIVDMTKIHVRFVESSLYLTCVTAAKLRRHLSNINVISNS